MNHFKDRCLVLIATCFGLGYLPVAPGTFGALPGVAIFAGITLWMPEQMHLWLLMAALLLVSAVTIVLTPWAERHWGRKDPNIFVTDEVAGFLATVLLFRTPDLLLTIIWAFCVTRVFDIIKIPPARKLEELPAGWGVLLDDLCASLYAAAFLHTVSACFPAWVGLP